MIPLEIVLLLIDGITADAIEMVASPIGRDGFAYGQAHGWMQAAAAMKERLNAAVETAQSNSERRDDDGSEEITDQDDTHQL